MRKLIVLPMAALLALAVAVPVSAGPNVSNSSGSALTAQGSWYSEAAGVETFGGLYAWQDSGASSAFVEYFEQVGAYVDCTPADQTDESFGFQGEVRSGYGEGTLTLGRGYADAQASGTLTTVTTSVDDCTGDYVESPGGTVAVSLDLVATGQKMMERGTSSFKIPGQFNSHSSYRTTSRIAAGTAGIGGSDIAVDGGIGNVTWRDHGNG